MKTYPRNLVATGPISMILAARASPSPMGMGWINLSFLMSLQVTRVGIEARLGGMMILIPEWRRPLMAPPRASTMKLMRKLWVRRVIVMFGL